MEQLTRRLWITVLALGVLLFLLVDIGMVLLVVRHRFALSRIACPIFLSSVAACMSFVALRQISPDKARNPNQETNLAATPLQ